MRTASQKAAIRAVEHAARQLLTEIEQSDTPWTDFEAYFHLHCSRTKLDESNYFRDSYGKKQPIKITYQFIKTVLTTTALTNGHTTGKSDE